MNRVEVELTLHRLAAEHVGRPVNSSEAIYQDAGLNGAEFYGFLVAVDDQIGLPAFRWDEFADMDEPPAGLSVFGKLRILPRKRLTLDHLAYVIMRGRWSDPAE